MTAMAERYCTHSGPRINGEVSLLLLLLLRSLPHFLVAGSGS